METLYFFSRAILITTDIVLLLMLIRAYLRARKTWKEVETLRQELLDELAEVHRLNIECQVTANQAQVILNRNKKL